MYLYFAAMYCLFTTPLASLNANSVSLITNYLQFESVRGIVIFPCSDEDMLRLSKFLIRNSNIWIQFCPEVGEIHRFQLSIAVVLDYDCDKSKNILRESSQAQLFQSKYHWLVLSETSFAGNLNLTASSKFIWARQRRIDIEIQDLFKIGNESIVQKKYLATWEAQNPVVSFKLPRRDLGGIFIDTAITLNAIPMDDLDIRLTSSKDRHLDTMAKYNYAIFLLLQGIYNFRMRLHPTRSYGYLVDKTRYDGSIGMLQDGTAKLCISSVLIKAPRLDVIEFTGPTWMFRACLMYRDPRAQVIDKSLFLPFSPSVWVSTACLWATILLVARITAKMESRITRRRDEDSWAYSCVFVAGVIGQQGSSAGFRWASWRVLLLFSCICASLLDIHYSASIVTSLLLPRPKTINGLRDLIDSNIDVGVVTDSYARDYFQTTGDPLSIELYLKKIQPSANKPESYLPLQQGVETMRTQPFAFYCEEVSMFFLVQKTYADEEKCNLATIGPLIPNMMTYVPIAKDSPYKEIIVMGLRELWERGHIRRLAQIWRLPKPTCLTNKEFLNVDLLTACPVFLILIFGVIMSISLLIFEIHISKTLPNGICHIQLIDR